MKELEQRIETRNRRHAFAAEESSERAVTGRSERVAESQDRRVHLRHAPQCVARMKIGGDEIGKLGKARERERRLVLDVIER